jgi:hypothetical protein
VHVSGIASHDVVGTPFNPQQYASPAAVNPHVLVEPTVMSVKRAAVCTFKGVLLST